MGVLRVINEDELDLTRLRQVWDDAVIFSRDLKMYALRENIQDGKKIIVSPDQLLIQASGGKTADIIVSAGGYIYHRKLKPFDGTECYADIVNEYMRSGRALVTDGFICVNLAEGRGVCEQIQELIYGTKNKPLTNKFSPARNVRPANNTLPANNSPVQGTLPANNNDFWICRCGNRNRHNFCSVCGTKRSEIERR